MAIKTGLPQLDRLAANGFGGASLETAVLTFGILTVSLLVFFLRFVRTNLSFPILQLPSSAKSRVPQPKANDELVWTQVLKDGAEKFDKPYMVNFADFGPTVILPPKYTDDVKNNKDMSLDETGKKDFFPWIPGFDAMRAGEGNHTFHDAVRVKLTQALTFFTEDLSDEAKIGLPEAFPVSAEWQSTAVYPPILDFVTRLSSLIFLGRDFEHIKAWREISASYTVNMFQAARVLRLWNPWLRPIVHWFLPETTKLREQVKVARNIIEPEVNRRRARRREAIKNGTQPKKSLDSVDWFEDSAQGTKFDFVAGELLLSVVAIHTTTGTLTNVLLDVAADSQLQADLRKEIQQVVTEDGGLQRTTLHKLKLMDSVLKESQRLHPLGQATLRRRVMKDVTLHDGVVLPQGVYTLVGPLLNFDATIYKEPYKFDGYRFYNKRQQAGEENKWQFVTTHPEHMGFGHGMHACPGRFFASNEIKVALMHMLTKYDWKLPEGQSRPMPLEAGLELPPNPTAQLQFRSRTPEVDF